MRLINATKLVYPPGNLELNEFAEHDKPKYAILSHRWGPEEVTYQELTEPAIFQRKNTLHKSGFRKIQQAARIAVDYRYQWLWCDTGCIDKTSSAELSEAINSMYRWYQESSLCIAYLADYPSDRVRVFTNSEWFERAWTFQELIAPSKLIFFNRMWIPTFENYDTGYKHVLADAIVHRTGIAKVALLDGKQLDKFSIAQKMSWAVGRKATKVEDIAYSLLGIFDVNMPMLYGEGNKAFLRLQEEIMRRSPDQSIFAWRSMSGRGLFAESPADFAGCSDCKVEPNLPKPFTLNNLGLDIELELRMVGLNTYIAPLGAQGTEGAGSLAHLLLEIDGQDWQLCRVGSISSVPQLEDFGSLTQRMRRVTIMRNALQRERPSINALNGFHLADNCLPLTVVNHWDPYHQWDRGAWARWNFQADPQNAAGPWGSVAQSAEAQSSESQWPPRRLFRDARGLSLVEYPQDERCKPTFVLPEKISTSIAMLVLDLNGQDKYLIQLAFDFAFNPCCHFSRMTLGFAERFRERNYNRPEEDKRLTWPFDEFAWKTYLRSKEAIFDDPATGKRSWIVKSLHRQEFVATVPLFLWRAHPGLEVSFKYHNGATREWAFSISSSSCDSEALLRLVGDQFAILDASSERRDRTPSAVLTP